MRPTLTTNGASAPEQAIVRPPGVNEFKNLFTFNRALAWHIGVEREGFLVDADGQIVPRAHDALTELGQKKHAHQYGYELSACQLEDRVGPCELPLIADQLRSNDAVIGAVLDELGLVRRFIEVAPADMPLDVYPDPSGRYAAIAAGMPQATLAAACRVTGTHVHVGMPDHETALRVYNHVIEHTAQLCTVGDGSDGERLRLYRVVKPDPTPRRYDSWEHFHEYAVKDGFADNPRNCWHLIRLSKHGTIEFRMFGATADIGEIVCWATMCRALCRQAHELSY